MPDRFEQQLREALHREAARLPFDVEADTVQQRLTSQRRARSILQFVAPVAAALALGVGILVAFPGPRDDAGQGGAASPLSTPLPSISAPPGGATPAPKPTATPLPGARNSPSVAIGASELYLLAGARTTPLTTAHRFDPAEGTWSSLPDLPEFRTGATAAVLGDGTLILAGGARGETALATSLILDRGAEQWRPGPELPYPQAHAAGASAGDLIYLAGGSQPGHEDALLTYAASTGEWTELHPMPAPLQRAAAVFLGDALYVLGGQTPAGEASAAVFRYNPGAATWERLADLPRAIGTIAATSVDGRIWVFGSERQAFSFDPAEGRWVELSRYARPGMSWYAAIPFEGRILVVSGSAGPTGTGIDQIGISVP